MANPNLTQTDGWNYRGHPAPSDSPRCLCTIEHPEAGRYVAFASWQHDRCQWWADGYPLVGSVVAWQPAPETAKGRFVHGELIINGEPV